MKKMADVYNITDFKFAKQMVDEIPKATETLEKAYNSLIPYRNYDAVANILYDMESAILQLSAYLPHFNNIVKNKGGKVE